MSYWSYPITKIEDGKEVLNPELQWSEAEDETLLGNSCALNVIFNDVDRYTFQLINICVSAKEAWGILSIVGLAKKPTGLGPQGALT